METVAVGPRQVDVWPNGQIITPIDSAIRWTLFDDHNTLHDDLVCVALTREIDEWGDERAPSRSSGGRRIYHLETWGSPVVDLIHTRAVALFKQAVGSATAAVDQLHQRLPPTRLELTARPPAQRRERSLVG
jgi:hypothetical protein